MVNKLTPSLDSKNYFAELYRNELIKVKRTLFATLPAAQEMDLRQFMSGFSREEEWDNVIAFAFTNFPCHHESPTEDCWLVKAPLTGICTGLALELILNSESCDGMNPSENARFFQKLFIPVLDDLCKEHQLTFKEITTDKFGEILFDRVYDSISHITNLGAKILIKHESLKELPNKIEILKDQGHCLLVLESPDNYVMDNHTLYVNYEKGIVGDGADGRVMTVGSKRFPDFLKYFLQKHYKNSFQNFSLIAVQVPPRDVRLPNSEDQTALNAQIKTIAARRKANGDSQMHRWEV